LLSLSVARRVGLAAWLFAVSPLVIQAAQAETRTLHLYNIHTHENLTIAYKRGGQFDEAALKRLNAFMRDWRKEQEVKMEPQLFDMLWEVHREVKASGPIHVVCGYRSPETNSMLRRRSGGVAKTSLHMQGKAIDFSIPSANVADVRAAALRAQGGGVGYYPTSGIPFVHMDVGTVRHWPRMTREQLAKVFPDGRTVHVPTDGNPLPGYELALADLERGNLRRSSPPRQRSLIASLFSAGQDVEEVSDQDTARQTPAATVTRRPAPPAPAPVQVAAAPEPKIDNVPLPRSRPVYQLAAAESRPAPAPAPRRVSDPVSVAALNPNDIINARGFWHGLPETPRDLPKVAAVEPTAQDLSSARRMLANSLAAAKSDITATVGPFARTDRVPADMALAYAAEADGKPETTATARPAMARGQTVGLAPAARVTTKGTASIAVKPALALANGNAARNADKLNDPWLRGIAMAPSVQNSMVVTVFGDPDFRTLTPYLWKPRTAVMMTFSHDPHLGMTAEAFSGSAVVFQATVTFDPRRTAALQ